MLAIAILAAGKGTRMNSALPKVLQKLAGKTLVNRVLENCEELNPDRLLLIVGHQAQKVAEHLKEIPKIEYVLQEPQNGTGHAIQQLIPRLKDFSGDLLVLNGDVPLLTSKTIKELLKVHKASNASVTFLSARVLNPQGYGRVFANSSGQVEKIVEEKDCTEEEKSNQLTNAGIYCFKWNALKPILPKLSSQNKQNELYLTDAIEELSSAKHLEVDDPLEVSGVNDRYQLAKCEDLIQEKLRSKWMKRGVTFINPASSTLSEDCNFGVDVVIEPQTHLRGKCLIGNGCILGPNTFINESSLDQNVCVIHSVLNNCLIKSNVQIGPFAHLRPQAEISERCRIGNFVEIKKSHLGEGSKVNHLSYIGDAEIGRQVNVGAGTITANYDGYTKNKTIIGDSSKTGANSVLIAPIVIGDNVTIGAGSTLSKNVPSECLAIARPKQKIKANWHKISESKK